MQALISLFRGAHPPPPTPTPTKSCKGHEVTAIQAVNLEVVTIFLLLLLLRIAGPKVLSGGTSGTGCILVGGRPRAGSFVRIALRHCEASLKPMGMH